MITEDQLALLAVARPSLAMDDVAAQCGETDMSRDGPYYEYGIAGTTESVEFWIYPPSPSQPARGRKIGIALVVRTEPRDKNKNSRIIWPRGLTKDEIRQRWEVIAGDALPGWDPGST